MMRSPPQHALLFVTLLALAACTEPVAPCAKIPTGDRVYVVGRGWHAEIGIPVEELTGPLAFTRTAFPGARVIMFGYGKKTFFTAPPETWSEYLLGPVPGPAAIHMVALRVTPPKAYPPEDTLTLALPPGGAKALSDFIGNDLAKDKTGAPRLVSRSHDPEGLFYEAVSGYSLAHTCNTWTADALQAGGLPVSGSGVMFSGQVMSRVDTIAESQCR